MRKGKCRYSQRGSGGDNRCNNNISVERNKDAMTKMEIRELRGEAMCGQKTSNLLNSSIVMYLDLGK